MTRRRARSAEQAPGWLFLIAGLGLGLIVALGVYLNMSQERAVPATSTQRDTPQAPAPDTATASRANAPAAADRFDFYEILPQFEVVVPEPARETPPRRETPQTPVDEPGTYVLQAGSFRSFEDADRLQASLALLGVESRIQRVTIDDDVYHRVRVGPIDDLNELNRTRRRLTEARVDTLLLRVPRQ